MNNKLQKLIEEYEDALYSDFFTVDNTEWDDEYLVYCGDIKIDAADMVVMITEEEFNALVQYIVDGWENGDGKIWTTSKNMLKQVNHNVLIEIPFNTI